MSKEDEMLVELRKIREAVEKAPPPAPPKGLWNEFKDFLSKYKIFGLAIAFIIALYLGTLVQASSQRFTATSNRLCNSRHKQLGNSHCGTIRSRRVFGCFDNIPYRCFTCIHCSQSCQKMANRVIFCLTD